ncbi:hypothetical protein TNCV_1106091 [Trichonephila clavipes]|nr:hypothetical protein TNCV_1106091 [Trichonephila clavipes]
MVENVSHGIVIIRGNGSENVNENQGRLEELSSIIPLPESLFNYRGIITQQWETMRAAVKVREGMSHRDDGNRMVSSTSTLLSRPFSFTVWRTSGQERSTIWRTGSE